MQRLLLLAVIALVAATGYTNFVKFAARPSKPVGWVDTADKQAKAMAKNMQIDSAPQPEIERYFWLLAESRDRQRAHDTAAAMQPIRPEGNAHEVEFGQRIRRLALAELFHDCAPDTVSTMQTIYEYDRRNLPAASPQIARDCNNLGLACFLSGQSSGDDAIRYDFLHQSLQWLNQAEAQTSADCKTDLVSIKENQLMVYEALKDKESANKCRKAVDELLADLKGPAPRVVL